MISSFSLWIFSTFSIISWFRGTSYALKNLWIFYSIIWILHLLLYITKYLFCTLGIQLFSLLHLGKEIFTEISLMKLIMLTLQWSVDGTLCQNKMLGVHNSLPWYSMTSTIPQSDGHLWTNILVCKGFHVYLLDSIWYLGALSVFSVRTF